MTKDEGKSDKAPQPSEVPKEIPHHQPVNPHHPDCGGCTHGYCNSHTLKCTCYAGYTGTHCDEKLISKTFIGTQTHNQNHNGSSPESKFEDILKFFFKVL